MAADLILVLGGARSGKSTHAQELALELGGESVLYVATATPFDDEMRVRIAAHRADRPSGWETLEAPHETGDAIARSGGEHGGRQRRSCRLSDRARRQRLCWVCRRMRPRPRVRLPSCVKLRASWRLRGRATPPGSWSAMRWGWVSCRRIRWAGRTATRWAGQPTYCRGRDARVVDGRRDPAAREVRRERHRSMTSLATARPASVRAI